MKLVKILENDFILSLDDLFSMLRFGQYEAQSPNAARKMYTAAETIIKYFFDKGLRFETGSTRVAFITDRAVYKVPLNFRGVDANIREFKMFKNRENEYIKVARCKIKYVSPYGFPVLMMELISDKVDKSDMPAWAWSVDCMQVGKTKKGDVVAYDV